MPELVDPEAPEATETLGSTPDAYSNFSFTPVYDGQAFTSAPFRNIFTGLQVKLNSVDREAISVGALTHEHLNAKPFGSAGVGSKGYILHSESVNYSKTASLPPGVWVHSSADDANILNSFSAGDLEHWSCGSEGPVGKPLKPTLRLGLNFQETEIWDHTQRSYAGGLVVFFDGIMRLIGNFEDQQAPEYEGKGAFYFLLHALISINGGEFEWYPIPVTERYVDCVPKVGTTVPGGRDGLNFNFRHLFTTRSIPFAHKYPGSTLVDIKSIRVRSFKVGVSLNRDRTDSTYQTLGFHISSYSFSYLAVTGHRNRLAFIPDSHGNLDSTPG